jgi:hypothetical protein
MYTMILLVYIGSLGKYEANTTTSVSFKYRELCEAAGKASVQAFGVGNKEAIYVCVKTE